MKHSELTSGMLREYLDSRDKLDGEGGQNGQNGQIRQIRQIDAAGVPVVGEETVKAHIEGCADCRAELKTLAERAAMVSGAFEDLPRMRSSSNAGASATAWAAFQRKQEESIDQSAESRQALLSPWKKWSLAGGGMAAAMLAVLLTFAPVRAWAESMLALFRVEHFTVLELNANAGSGLQNDPLMNQSISRILSDEVTITRQPQKPAVITDASEASKLAGFPVKLFADRTPAALLLESGFGAQMKLDRDRLQAIFDEAGRDDLRIPRSVDGATIGVRIPAGIMARYGNCGSLPAAAGETKTGQAVKPADPTCINLVELPSPVVSAPKDLDPGQIAQVALQFLGMSANDAASFTQTVDWTSTLVLPIVGGQSSYKQVHINGKEGVLLRGKGSAPVSGFSLMWVGDGIVYALNGTGDDTTAMNLAEQLE